MVRRSRSPHVKRRPSTWSSWRRPWRAVCRLKGPTGKEPRGSPGGHVSYPSRHGCHFMWQAPTTHAPRGERQRPPCSASRRCMKCVHGATAQPAPIEETARDQLLQRVLHHRPVEAKPDGAGHLIGRRAMRLLRRDRGQDLRRCGRRAGRRRRVRVLCYGTACLSLVLSGMSGDTACLCRHATPPIRSCPQPDHQDEAPFSPGGVCRP